MAQAKTGSGNAVKVLFFVFMFFAGAILLVPRILPTFEAMSQVTWVDTNNPVPPPPPKLNCQLLAAADAAIATALGATTLDAVQLAVMSQTCTFHRTPDGNQLAQDSDAVMMHQGSNGVSPDILNPGRTQSNTLIALNTNPMDDIPADLFNKAGENIYKVNVVENRIGELGIVKITDPTNKVVAEVQFIFMHDREYGDIVISFIENYERVPGFGARLSQVTDHMLFNWAKGTGRQFVRRIVLATSDSQTRYGPNFLRACGCALVNEFEGVKVIGPNGLESLQGVIR